MPRAPALPQPSPWPARMDVAPDTLTLQAAAKGLKPEADPLRLLLPVHAETLIRHAAPQTAGGDARRPHPAASSAARSPSARRQDAGGVLVVEEAIGAAPRRDTPSSSATSRIAAAAPHGARSPPILQAALLALLGGIILNLMPCVFPVLSIKVLSLIEQAGQSREQRAPARPRLHRRRAGDVRRPGRRCCWRCAPAGARDRLGLPAAVAGHRRRAGLRAVRHGPQPLRRVPLRLFAAGRRRQPGARARACRLVLRRRAGGRGGDALHGAVHGAPRSASR